MLRTKIAIATLAALYAAGAGASLPLGNGGVSHPDLAQRLKPIELDANQVQGADVNAPARHDTRTNVQLDPAAFRADDQYVAQPGNTAPTTFIVVLNDKPVSTYDGDIAGLTATGPAIIASQPAMMTSSVDGKGRLNFKSTPVQAYKNYLTSRQNSVVSKARGQGIGLSVAQRYTNAISGMAAVMTPQDAEALAKLPEVRRVYPARTFQLNTDVGPQFIGADKIWNGTVTGGSAYQGEGMVAGIIDTGINYAHPSFAAVGGDGYHHVNPRGAGSYVGDCVSDATLCNDKLIGVRSYPEITGVYSDPVFQSTAVYTFGAKGKTFKQNGMDYHGHGSHTASTVAGNVLFDVPFQGQTVADGHGDNSGFTFGRVSGVAPHANIIAYQVCWPGNSGDPYAGCPEVPMLKAIDDAIADGVDTINFSIGGGEQSPWEDGTEIAFLNAREAGIHVAVAAGNNGNAASTLGHVAPWETVVAASTHGRSVTVTGKTLGSFSGGNTTLNGSFTGYGISAGVASTDIVWAGSLADPVPDDNIPPERCAKPFPAGSLTGKIVVCDRGTEPRLTKAQNVLAGGAAGFVLRNVASADDSTMVNDIFPLPAVSIKYSNGNTLKNWLTAAGSSGHKAAITASTIGTSNDGGDKLAFFSSRGPSATTPESLVPHIAAPGVDVYAANTTSHPFTMYPSSSDWTMMSGTSMASPHVSGAAVLIRQAHPDWTPAEVHSALVSTAIDGVIKKQYTSGSTFWGLADFYSADMYDAVFGRIDVAKAVNAGLIMDESAENMRLADPANGGSVGQLNLPQLVNFNCRGGTCTWLRTVKATQDGTWTVSSQSGEYSVQVTATPSTFTLKKGETQTLLLTANIVDSMTLYKGSEGEVHAKVILTPSDALMPVQHWPVAMSLNHGTLPENVDIEAHRNQGRHTVTDLATKSFNNPAVRTFGLVKADKQVLSLKPDTEVNWTSDKLPPPWADPELDNGSQVLFFDVPENTATFTVESGFNLTSGYNNAFIYLGLDVNGDGKPQWKEEAICYSTAYALRNFCRVNMPKAGRYWAVVERYAQNPTVRTTGAAMDIPVYSAIVPKADNGNLSVAVPTSNDGKTPFNVDLSWDLPEGKSGDVYFGAYDIGTYATNPGNLGLMGVRLVRGVDDVTLDASNTGARPGDTVHYTLNVLPNLTVGADRRFDLKATLPQGLSLVAGSVKQSGLFTSGAVVDGNTISLSGVQRDSSKDARRYAITTSDTDASCMADPDFGGYIDLRNFGDFRVSAISGSTRNSYTLKNSQVFGKTEGIPLFGQRHEGDALIINPAGFIHLDPAAYFNLGGYTHMTTRAQPWQQLAPLVGANANYSNYLWTKYETTAGGAKTGVSVATLAGANGAPDAVIVQWDGTHGETVGFCPFGGCPGTPDGSNFDYQVVARGDIDYRPGHPEIVFGYKSLTGPFPVKGVVGLRGYEGISDSYGPLTATMLGAEYAYDDLATKLHDNLQVCYDYHGPEESQFALEFDAYVDEEAVGQDLVVTVDNGLEGADNVVLEAPLKVAGNLRIGAIANQTTEEDTALNGIGILYADMDNGSNVITVSGDHVSAVVHDTGYSSSFDLVPEKDFVGTTEVTVTVTDRTFASDKASTTFLLTVTPSDDAPVAAVAQASINATAGDNLVLDASPSHDADGDALSYAWTQKSGPSVTIANAKQAKANLNKLITGDYVFEVSVSDGKSSSKAQVSVKVAALTTGPKTNTAPVAAVASVGTSLKAGDSVSLDASTSSDADNDNLTYSWVQVSGPAVTLGNASQAKVSLSGLSAGDYVFEVTVSDGTASSKTQVAFKVAAASTPTPSPTPTPSADTGSGGGGGAIGGVLLLLPLLALRRRHKTA